MMMIVKIMVMMIDRDDLPSEAQNERGNDMEPGNNREEISEERKNVVRNYRVLYTC